MLCTTTLSSGRSTRGAFPLPVATTNPGPFDDEFTALYRGSDDTCAVPRQLWHPLLVTVRRRAWERDLPFRLHGGKPLIRELLDLVGQDPLYQPAVRAAATVELIE
jgi:hypothetical protein